MEDLRYFLEITENDEADLEFEASIRGSSRGRESTKSMASETVMRRGWRGRKTMRSAIR